MDKEINNRIFSFRALEMQEMDRKRISMDIHDTTVQNLTTLIHKTEFVTKLLEIDIVRAKLELCSMTEIIRSSIDELREIIYDLRPMSIDDLGLVATLERYINQMKAESDSLKYVLEVYNKENTKILSIVNLTIFRIIQEALVNVRKHALAAKVEVIIIYESNYISITINDDGIGFDKIEIEKMKRHFGLSIMEERVKLLSGKMQLESKKDEGTIININIPITEDEKYGAN